MSISDWIQVIAILVSLAVSVISIVQTRKSTLEANKPYVSIYVDIIDTSFFGKYLVVKNFGKTSAKILSLEFQGLDKDPINKKRQLQSLVGGTIAPNQKFSTTVENDFTEIVTAKIIYEDYKGKITKESFTLNFSQTSDMMWKRDETRKRSDEAKAINNAAHAIVKTLK
ncbi:hypothetical protein DUC53_001679 [Enterococcus faecium]|nr:hypothetical protein [Enterococcus faecium]NTK79003.1 hypothetical protein [Enterococcus faecium]